MSQTMHQQLVELHIRARAWLDRKHPEKFDPWHGICHHLKPNPSDGRLIDRMAQWPGYSGAPGYPVPHPTMDPKKAFNSALPWEMWDPKYEYARNRWALLDWLIDQTAPTIQLKEKS